MGGTTEKFRIFIPDTLEQCSAHSSCSTFESGDLMNTPSEIFDIEVMEGEIVYRGSEIKARNKDHALQIMILMSGGQVNENSEIISFEEKTLH